MDKCYECIHDGMSGCMMLDCIHHPYQEKCSEILMTNTFRDHFTDRKKPFNEEVEVKC